MATSPRSAKERAPDSKKRKSGPTGADLLEEVRQLRAAMAIYRRLVNRLLADRVVIR